MLRWKVNVLKKPQGREVQNYAWSSQSFTLNEVKTRFKLPCVVKCCYESCPLDWADFHFDLAQPLLLHSFRKVNKLRVRCTQKGESGQSKEFGPSMVIPEDYDGWFYIMDTDDARPRLHKTVESLSGGTMSKFYVASSLSYLALNDEPEGNKKTTIDSRHMEAGEILERSQTAGTSTLKKTLKISTENVPNEKYLVCTDEKDDRLILPMSKTGHFYEISDNTDDTSNGLRRISYIMKKKELFPFKIRHVIGELPAISSSYTSVLQCLEVLEEETILASTLDKMTMIPLELQLNSPFKFKMALNESQLRQSGSYGEALRMCETDGEVYVRGIKISFTISPNNVLTSVSSIESESSSMCVKIPKRASCAESESVDDIASFCDTGSEVEEEDAQSEFMFEWEPQETVRRLSSKKKDTKLTKPPKVFNSSINTIISPKSSMEENINMWNEQPDVV